MSLLTELESCRSEVERELSTPDHYAFLPEIKASLDQMIDDLNEPKSTRGKHASALGRLVTEDYAFSESALGEKLLSISDSYPE